LTFFDIAVRSAAAAAASLLVSSMLLASDVTGPRLIFTRLRPAEINLGPVRTIALIEISGARDANAAAAALIRSVDQNGTLRLVDARRSRLRAADVRRDRDRTRALRSAGVEALLSIEIAGCDPQPRTRSASFREGATEYWYESSCDAHARLLDPGGADIVSFEISGTGTSEHASSMLAASSAAALDQAVERIATHLAGKISPRQITESIRLDKDAPAFQAGYEAIRSNRYEEARTLWRRELERNGKSAALHYNLAAVSESLGDAAAARHHLEQAIALDPGNDRYGKSLDALEQRLADAVALESGAANGTRR
jgi:tetratricopeptide (TPR) repeat protein